MSGKVIMNIVEPTRKKIRDILRWMIMNKDKDKSPTDVRRDSFGGSKVISHAGKFEDPAKIIKKSMEEEKNDK